MAQQQMILLYLFTLAQSDLPVQCTYLDFLGDWTFTVNEDTFYPHLHKSRTYCGHGQPDQVLTLYADQPFQFEDSSDFQLTFSQPNLVSSPQLGEGTWTMVYNQGILVYFQSVTFITFSLYVKEKAHYKSVCDHTTIGWYKYSQDQWGCFFGVKKESSNREYQVTSESEIKWVQPSYMSFLQDFPAKYEDQTGFVEQLNQNQSSWTAGLHSEFIGLSVKQVNQKVGNKVAFSRKPPQSPQSEQLILLEQTDTDILAYWDTPVDQININQLPKNWDWSDLEGVNYISEPRSQKNCGSCYAISTVEMLEARLRILTDFQFDERLSIQYLLSCSFYTQGCDGGFPTLLNKFISEFGLVSEQCVPYKAKLTRCHSKCEDGFLVKVSDYYYIGGYYGASNQVNMIKELRARGPIIGNLEPGLDFSYYKDGIYCSVAMRDDPNDTMRSEDLTWEKVDHSVLIVGYGEENGQKYWKVLNSWGSKWGEKGYFRIRRGTDEASIESMAEAAVPYIINL